jgi:hypothetical protein
MRVKLTQPPAIWRIGYVDDQGGSVWYVLAYTKEDAVIALKRHWGHTAEAELPGRMYFEKVLSQVGDVDRGGFV